MARFFGRILEPFRRLSKEEEINAAVVERIRLQSEDELHRLGVKTDREWELARLLRRLRPLMADAGISNTDLLSWNGKKVYSISVRPNLEKGEIESYQVALVRAGLVRLEDDSWILSPSRTPQNLKQGDLHSWASRNLPGDLSNRSLLELVELRKGSEDGAATTAGRRDIILSVLHGDEILPARRLYLYLKRRRIFVEDLIMRADIVFLASAFANQEALERLEKSKAEATQRLLLLAGGLALSLGSLSNLPEGEVAEILEDYVPHAKDFAQRLTLEATYWLRFLEQVDRRAQP